MTHLRSQTSVECGASEAEARLSEFFESQRRANGTVRMRLRVPVARSDAGLRISLGREVRITARRTRDDENRADLIRIAWQPEGRSVLPTFEGTLIVRGEEKGGRSSIELDGYYTPPLDGTGALFDKVIGHRIAQSTAREFLADLKHAIERAQPVPNGRLLEE